MKIDLDELERSAKEHDQHSGCCGVSHMPIRTGTVLAMIAIVRQAVALVGQPGRGPGSRPYRDEIGYALTAELERHGL